MILKHDRRGAPGFWQSAISDQQSSIPPNFPLAFPPSLSTFLPPMPKAIARSKTKKAVAKRFKITGTGKILRSKAAKRHLLASKSAKRKRHLAKAGLVDKTDMARIIKNLPFSH
jgi:large subunit ribosomal protein L35